MKPDTAAKKIIASVLFLFSLSQAYAQTYLPADFMETERKRVVRAAEHYLKESPVTITSFRAERSAGGTHDYYSEGTYWWPDPGKPDGPYIRRDGINNPDNFVSHSNAMERFSVHTAALTAAFRLTRDIKYASHAINHFRAWFIDSSTRMNPNLLYAQAIKGVVTGRGIGIIDAIHLIEAARSAEVLEAAGVLKGSELSEVKKWFREFLNWMTSHQYGLDEKKNGNNHSTWWCAQAVMYARLAGEAATINSCRQFLKEELIPKQIDSMGRFPLELARTKPYSYSLFNLEGFALICLLASTEAENLWEFETSDGKSVKKAFEFLFPYIADKTKWPYKKDLVNFERLPVRMQGLCSAAVALGRPEYMEVWSRLTAELENAELIRTFALRQPVLWMDNK